MGDATANCRVYEAIKPVECMPRNITIIQSKCEFVHIAAKVFGAGVVIDAVQAKFQDRPNAFDAVGAHATPDLFFRDVVDSLITEKQTVQVASKVRR